MARLNRSASSTTSIRCARIPQQHQHQSEEGQAMDSFIGALAPAFACGLALQRLLEILDPVIEAIPGVSKNKKLILALVALLAGLAFAAIGPLRVLERLGIEDRDTLDFFVTALLVSAGTEGFNSLLKFLGYAKEAKKNEAATDAGTTTEELQRQV
jgi:hypothetical protein